MSLVVQQIGVVALRDKVGQPLQPIPIYIKADFDPFEGAEALANQFLGDFVNQKIKEVKK